MANDEVTAYVAVFGGIAAFTALLSVVAVRARKATDAASLALRASDVVAQAKDLLAGPDFLWAVWNNTTDLAAKQMLIRNHRDDVVSTVVTPNVVLDGVLKRFDLDGTSYEIRKPGLMTNRTHLCEAGRDEVLLQAEHTTFSTTFYRGDGTTLLCTVSSGSALTRFLPITVDAREIGKVIAGLRQDSSVRILSMADGHLSLLERVYVLAR